MVTRLKSKFSTRVFSSRALVATCAIPACLWLAACAGGDTKPDDKPTQSNGGTSAVDEKKELQPKDHFDRGVAAMTVEKGKEIDLASAKVAFAKAFEKDPTLALARYNTGVILEKEGKHDEAKIAYRDAFDADPTLDLAVDNLGILLEAAGDIEGAKALYNDAISKNKEAVGPRLRLAKIFKEEDDARQASILAREALQFDAKSADAYRLLAVLYAEAGKNQLARLVAVRGQKLAPADPELQYALAVVSENERDVAAARALYSIILETTPNHAPSRIRLAEMALKNRDWKTATVQLKNLSEKHATNPNIHNALGLALKGQGDFEQAKANYEKAIAVDDTYAPARFNLGLVLLRNLDDPAAAEKMFSTYLDIGGEDDTKARTFLAEARTVIQALEDEKRMLAEMALAEEAAAKEAAETAAREEEERKAAEAQAKEDQAVADKAAAEQAAADKAAADKAAADNAAKETPTGDAAGAKDAEPAAPPAAEPPAAEEKKADPPPKKAKKRRKRRKKPKAKPKKEEKPDGPERDDDFYD